MCQESAMTPQLPSPYANHYTDYANSAYFKV